MTPAAVLPRGFQGLHTCGVTGIRVCRDARQKRPVFCWQTYATGLSFPQFHKPLFDRPSEVPCTLYLCVISPWVTCRASRLTLSLPAHNTRRFPPCVRFHSQGLLLSRSVDSLYCCAAGGPGSHTFRRHWKRGLKQHARKTFASPTCYRTRAVSNVPCGNQLCVANCGSFGRLSLDF